MTELPAYLIGLVAASIFGAAIGLLRRNKQILRVTAVIVANFILGYTYVQLTEDGTPWAFSLIIDIIAATIVMWHPAGRAQGFFGIFYLAQIACHIAFGLREWLGLQSSEVFYYDVITYIAWAQLIAMGAWGGAVWIRSSLHSHGGHSHAFARVSNRLHHGGKK